MVFQCVSGVGMATSVRVSNCLGGGMPRTAKRAVAAGLIVTIAFEGAAMAAVAGFHRQLPWALTSAPKVGSPANALALAVGGVGRGAWQLGTTVALACPAACQRQRG